MSFQHKYASLICLETPNLCEKTILSLILLLHLSVNVGKFGPLYDIIKGSVEHRPSPSRLKVPAHLNCSVVVCKNQHMSSYHLRK